MNWDSSPKLQFDKRRLERCYQLDYKDTEYKEECLKKSKELSEKKPMGYKSRPHREPYWNFWRAVFAGWLIRYPFQILKGIGTVVIGLFLFGVLVFSPSNVEEPRDIVERSETIGYNN